MVTLDVLIEILSRLSPEPLLRFKSVSKLWYTLIDDPKFVAKHLSVSLQQKHLHIKRIVTNNSEETEFVSSILKFPLHQSMSILDVHFPFHDDYMYIHFFGHSHGLTCIGGRSIGGRDEDIFLCNLATRQFRKLPPSIIRVDELRNRREGDYVFKHIESSRIGFGYDTRSRDFKVFTVMYIGDLGQGIYPTRAEIYDMSKDRWREIEPPNCSSTFWTPLSFKVFHEGKIYWLMIDATGHHRPVYEMILTFDISEEVFCETELPDSLNKKKYNKNLGILNGSVVLFNYPYDDYFNEKSFDIWEMEKDESGSIWWSKLFTIICPNFRLTFPLLFVSSDELLIECEEGVVILYNIKTQQFIQLPIKGHPRLITDDRRYDVSLFVKSLLSVEGGNNVRYEF